MTKTETLVERYIALWTNPDPEERRKEIEALWADDGAHILEPPEAVRDAARDLAFVAPPLEARGHEWLEHRVTRAYEMFIGTGEHRFRQRGKPSRLHDVVKLAWEMVPAGSEEVAGSGIDFLVLDEAGRIVCDYQFIDD